MKMNWFTWYLFEDEVNGYFWRIGFLLIFMFLIVGMPSMGKLLYWILIFDVMHWFFHKKPRLKEME